MHAFLRRDFERVTSRCHETSVTLATRLQFARIPRGLSAADPSNRRRTRRRVKSDPFHSLYASLSRCRVRASKTSFSRCNNNNNIIETNTLKNPPRWWVGPGSRVNEKRNLLPSHAREISPRLCVPACRYCIFAVAHYRNRLATRGNNRLGGSLGGHVAARYKKTSVLRA